MGVSSTSRPVAVAADSTTDDLEDEEPLTIAEQLGLNDREQEEDEEIITAIYQILNEMFANNTVQIENFLVNSISLIESLMNLV